jgi:hypothetical protein
MLRYAHVASVWEAHATANMDETCAFEASSLEEAAAWAARNDMALFGDETVRVTKSYWAPDNQTPWSECTATYWRHANSGRAGLKDAIDRFPEQQWHGQRPLRGAQLLATRRGTGHLHG